MSNVIGMKEFKFKSLEQLILNSLKHDDERVLAVWKQMASEAFKRWPGPPGLEESLSVQFPECVSSTEANQIGRSFEQYLAKYQSVVSETMEKMLGEIILLQKSAAEKALSDA